MTHIRDVRRCDDLCDCCGEPVAIELSPESYEHFLACLAEPPKEIPGLRRLMNARVIPERLS